MSRLAPFLLGFVAMADLVALIFFLRFWRGTRDLLFGAFAAFFLFDSADRVALLFSDQPNEGSPWIYIIRVLGLLFILAAILAKNFKGRGP